MTEKSKNYAITENDFRETKCIFCSQASDSEMYPEKIYEDSISSHTFSARREGSKEHYRIVSCDNCSLVRSNPVLTESKLTELYSDSHFIFSDEVPYVSVTYAELLRKLVDKYSLPKNSLVEIGCSTGFFLEKALDMGIKEVKGFEPSRECYEHASESIKSNIVNDVYTPDLLNGKKYDIACNFQVIDHLLDPVGVLSSVRECLNPGGHILIVCHDVASWSAKFLGDKSPVFDIEHIYLFSQKTISMLLEAAGYEVMEVGSLSNKYPLAYWMKMLPVADKMLKVIPSFIRGIPISIKAGNLYVLGKKSD